MIPTVSPDKYTAAIKICIHLVDSGCEALFAGGVVRDMLLGRMSDDIDIATSAIPDKIARLFPHTVPVGAQFGVMIVVQNGIPFEVATFRSDQGIADGRHPAGVVFTNAKEDALRRDFTINGLFYNPLTEEIIDYVGGRDDLAAKVIKAIGDPVLRFSEDYLRMLRAIRFAARFDYVIEEGTWSALCSYAVNINRISVERIFAELNKMFCSAHPKRALELLDQSGLLALVLPEVAALKGVEQPPQFHPEGDVFEHVKMAMGLLGPSPSSVLAWSTLLHDIGKPATKTLSDRIRFNNHDQVGMQMAERLLKRFHTPNAFIEEVTACVGNHMHFMHVQHMRLGTLKKFLARSTMETELALHRIDCTASHGNCENYEFLTSQLQQFRSEQLKPEPLLRGRDLLALGFSPGPKIGEIINAIYDLQLEEVIFTREQALKVVQEQFTGNGTPGIKD